MELIKGIEAKGKALWIKRHKILIIGDLHIGYEEALAKSGVYAPRRAFSELKKEVEILIAETRPVKIIINGDLKHEFGEISNQEWREVMEILDIMRKGCEEVILIKGNHDKILGPIAERMNLRAEEYYHIPKLEKRGAFDLSVGSICVLHGDKILKEKDVEDSDILIIGHEHPAISLSEGEKNEKYKCFLVGKWKRQKLIVIPSFFSLIEGTDINNEKLLSPYLHQDIGKFEVYVIGDDKIYKFGHLKNLD